MVATITETREQRLETALKTLLLWRAAVNHDPHALVDVCDPEGVALSLFNGPAWDAAEMALGETRVP
ncbi:MAG TPA: hypothetical protein VNM37_12850 [Candidatus Dormibacteraeota bacterium]|nr:hypothetical protein [Candidatus Dormibacteraeota bacterium]